MTTPGKYIRFEETQPERPRKTKVWNVVAFDGDVPLGSVYWWPNWRGYVFAPLALTIYEKRCLRDIADFVEEQNRLHREQLKSAKGGKKR